MEHRQKIEKKSKPTFRADIEGLRGVAVLLVLLFHASIPGFSGGFVGVDVFFVISGFLITGMLLREIETTGKISLSNFYARRVRRLMPAAALVLIVTLVASLIILPPLAIRGVAVDIASAALYVSNIVFAFRATDYFAAGSAPSPILHFWSLGVEEQYYIFWPAIFLLVAYRARKPRLRVGSTVVLLGISSFSFATYLVTRAGPWAFFSLPTRAWELALGGIIAVIGARLSKIPMWIAATVAWLGLVAVIYSGIFIKASAPFPSFPALVPTLGAAGLIIGGSRITRLGPTRILGSAIPQFLGKISYSLYLWHWPLLVLPLSMTTLPLNIYERCALAIAAIPLAYATHRWVEDPLRRGQIIGTNPRKNLAMALALAVTVAALAMGSSLAFSSNLQGSGQTTSVEEKLAQMDAILKPFSKSNSGTATRSATIDAAVPANLEPSLINASTDRALSYLDRCHTQMDLPPSTLPCLYGDTTSKTTIVLFGDSHALSWFPAVDALAKKDGWKLLSLTMSACSPADIPGWNPANNSVMKNCTLWRADSLKRIAAAHPLIVLVAGTRGFETIDSNGKVLKGNARISAWRAGMKKTVDKLKSFSKNVIYIADTPSSQFDPAICLSAHPNSSLACSTPVDKALSKDWLAQEISMTIEEKIQFIDAGIWICPTSPCPVILGNILIYSDGGHLTATFSAALATHMRKAVSVVTGIPLKITAPASP